MPPRARCDTLTPMARLAIDRLIVRDDHILAVDFKSNATVPQTPDQVPEGILRQMGAYAHALAQIWPGRRIETAILWTASGELMALPAGLTSAALNRSGSLPAALLDAEGGRT